MERVSHGADPFALPPAAATRPPAATMPAFSTGTQAHHHSVHSALATLSALGVPAHRIALLRSGREAVEAGTIVRQEPEAGSPLLPDTTVRLYIAGLGFTHSLPVGMWDSGGETHAGTREILEGLDDPLEKLAHWFHEGAPLFRIGPTDLGACARWLRLFGVDAELWPHALWYRLASLIAGMAQYSCSEQGMAFVLQSLLGLRVRAFRYLPTFKQVPQGSLSALGSRASRLGVDLLVGDAVEDLASLEIEIGPVTLEEYEYFSAGPEGSRLVAQILAMIMPLSTDHAIRWVVLDETRAPRLGVGEQNSRLGINTHMGGGLASGLLHPSHFDTEFASPLPGVTL